VPEDEVAEADAVGDCATEVADRTTLAIKNVIQLWRRRGILLLSLIRQITSANLNRPIPGSEKNHAREETKT
jgi:hypothetical protein